MMIWWLHNDYDEEMNWDDGIGIVTLWLTIERLTKQDRDNEEQFPRKVEKAEQTETMMARWHQEQTMLTAEDLR